MNNNENNNVLNDFNEMFNDNKPKEVVEPYRAVSNNNFNQANNQTQMVNTPQQVVSDYVNQPVENINQNINPNQPVVSDIINSQKNDVQNIIMPEVNKVNNFNNVADVNPVPLYDTTNSINDVKVERKVKKNKIKISKDMQTIIILAAVLLLVISILPSIFDLIDSLKNNIFG